ncbi:MAG: translation initiation factor IF-5A [Thermoprotei archaeon]|nr:MAG: translation initiation factor IF-5A [Thermoprotei archaeon]
MSITYAELGELREGSYIVIDGEPCKIVEMSRAKTGKHGSAKVHIVAIGMFTGSRKTLVAPSDQRVEVPIIEKRTAQVLAITGNTLQLMDLESYETFEVDMPEDKSLASKLVPGSEVEYWVIMGRRKIIRVK